MYININQDKNSPRLSVFATFFVGGLSIQGKPPQEWKHNNLFKYIKNIIRTNRNAPTAPRKATASVGTEIKLKKKLILVVLLPQE